MAVGKIVFEQGAIEKPEMRGRRSSQTLQLSCDSQLPKITCKWAPPTDRGGRIDQAQWQPSRQRSGQREAREPRTDTGGGAGAGCAAMPVRHRELGDELAPPEPKRCRHCDGTMHLCSLETTSNEKTVNYIIF